MAIAIVWAFPATAKADKSFYVVSSSLHAEIALDVATVPRDELPVIRDFPGARYLVIGWGNDEFYRAKKVTLPILLRAIFLAESSVLHGAAVPGTVESFFPRRRVYKLSVSDAGFAKMLRYLNGAFALDGFGKRIPVQHGFYPSSQFYQARGKYFLLKTCNVWTARALREAGLPVSPPFALTSGNLMWQLRHSRR